MRKEVAGDDCQDPLESRWLACPSRNRFEKNMKRAFFRTGKE